MAGGRLIAPTGAPRTRFDEVPRYAEGLYEVGEGLYAWMVPNGSWGESNAGLIVGDGEALLVDTLWDIPCTRAMLDAMAPFTENAPIGRVANTHADGDHFWGNQLLSGVEIVATRECFEESRRVLPRSMRLLGTLGRVLEKTGMKGPGRVGHWLSGMVRPYDFKSVTPAPATRTFQGELTLRVGGREVRLMG
jgi:glyoxylase-like metal-dependent hydrolase (beta-lactamase superfamily II)